MIDLIDATPFLMRSCCGEWGSFWLALYFGSNMVIFISYFTIAVELCIVASRGLLMQLVELKSEFFLFAAFIFLCGGGHALDGCGSFVYPAYRLFAVWHALTAIVSAWAAGVVMLNCVRIIREA